MTTTIELNQISKDKIDLESEINLLRKKIKSIGSYKDINDRIDTLFQSFLTETSTFEKKFVNEVSYTYFATLKPLVESIFNSSAYDMLEQTAGVGFELDDMTIRNLDIMWESYFLSPFVDASPGEDRENYLSLFKSIKNFFCLVLIKRAK
jgi:hypothetical protein